MALLAINEHYRELAPLATGSTSELLRDRLEQVGFRVELLRNPTNGVLLAALRRLETRPDSVDMALIYFVGYTRQLREKNFLLPANADPKSAFDLLTQGVDLDGLRNAAATVARRLGLVIIDGAYPEPQLDAIAELRPGLAPAPMTGITLILLSAPPGQMLAPDASPEALARAFSEAFEATLVKTASVDEFVEAFNARATRDAAHQVARFSGPALPTSFALEVDATTDGDTPPASGEPADPELIDPAASARAFSAEPIVPTEAADFEASLTDTQRRDVQRALRQIGLYRGSIDGQFGPLTRDAVKIFQRSRALPPTGRVDVDLMHTLLDLMEP
ncbi:MAG: peptidoglycan-binding protein [Lamprobacter sp.]|uniref:peptidoglycan-binding protein n=1 Tax=Lamprobacter sp. TaxID=3100796 RepID=UPI002B2579C1|nr:peptidoglycan-binding protein [Lamprobacter sp.]MEA3639199.1 peptidoglycan-binding protein [Lamprobacter sp.]